MVRRYERNIGMLSLEEMEKVRASSVCVIGCGGLGGYIIEFLARLGVGKITAVDGDVFDETNLNRQLLSYPGNIGTGKAGAAEARVNLINPDVSVYPLNVFLDEKNADEIVHGHDVVIDALDSIGARLVLQEACKREEIPLVHGAIAGWYGQVSTIFPGDDTLRLLYPENAGNSKGIEKQLGNPSFTPALVASIESGEVLKVIIGRGSLLRNRILRIDLLEQEYDIIEIK